MGFTLGRNFADKFSGFVGCSDAIKIMHSLFTSTGRRKHFKVALIVDIVFTVVKCKYLGT
jgi:hypothetical protein